MKKHILAIAIFALAIFLVPKESLAQFGIKGGIYVPQYSKLKDYDNYNVKNNIGFQAGVAYQITLLPVFTLQPELLFVQRETKVVDEADPNDNRTFRQQFLQLPVSIQYGIDLGLVHPYVQAVPYINYLLDGKITGYNWKDSHRFTYGIGVGAGLELWKLQLNVRYNWDISKVGGKQSRDPLYERYRVSKGKAFEVSLAYFF